MGIGLDPADWTCIVASENQHLYRYDLTAKTWIDLGSPGRWVN
jgi:hypothetical protein